MKVSELLTEAYSKSTDKGHSAPSYDQQTKILSGTVKDWMSRIGASSEDIASAIQQAKDLPSYKDLVGMVGDSSTAGSLKNGTFNFRHPKDPAKAKYMVYANGQLRATSPDTMWGTQDDRPSRMTSPKPRLVHGDPVKSLVKIYDQSFKELGKKAKTALKKYSEKK